MCERQTESTSLDGACSCCSLFPHSSSWSGFWACTHVPGVFLKLVGPGFRPCSATWALAPSSQHLTTAPWGWSWIIPFLNVLLGNQFTEMNQSNSLDVMKSWETPTPNNTTLAETITSQGIGKRVAYSDRPWIQILKLY